MNYFLTLLIIGMAGFAYYQHNQDEQQVTALQQQLVELQAKASQAAETAKAAPTPPAPQPTVVIAPEIKVVSPSPHVPTVDAAIASANTAAASTSSNLDNLSTLDGHTYHHCKVLKVEADGVTFNHDDGITKVLFPFLPPNVQKQFNYDPQQAVAQTAAQVRYTEQQAAATSTATATPNP